MHFDKCQTQKGEGSRTTRRPAREFDERDPDPNVMGRTQTGERQERDGALPPSHPNRAAVSLRISAEKGGGIHTQETEEPENINNKTPLPLSPLERACFQNRNPVAPLGRSGR